MDIVSISTGAHDYSLNPGQFLIVDDEIVNSRENPGSKERTSMWEVVTSPLKEYKINIYVWSIVISSTSYYSSS